MTIIDLSQPFAGGMPVYPGGPQPAFVPAATLERDGFRETRLRFHSHNGTHVDAPAHLLAGGRGLDDYPADAFFGPAAVLDCRLPEGEMCAAADAAVRRGAQFLLLHTGHDACWGGPAYFQPWPLPATGAVRHMAALHVKGIGIDALSIDGLKDDLPRHRLAFERGVLLFENLRGLSRLPESGFLFSAMPIRLPCPDGAPVRAAALLLP